MQLAGLLSQVPSLSSLLIELYIPKYFFAHAASLHQGFPHCAIFPTAASPAGVWAVSQSQCGRSPSLRLNTDRRFGGRYPANCLIRRGPILTTGVFHRAMQLCAYACSGSRFSCCYPPVWGQVTRVTPPSPLSQLKIIRRINSAASLDLHVLSTPPAFILSQDQTL